MNIFVLFCVLMISIFDSLAMQLPIPRCFSCSFDSANSLYKTKELSISEDEYSSENESDLEIKELLSNISGYRYIIQDKRIRLTKLFDGRKFNYVTDIINSPKCNKPENILTIDRSMPYERIIDTDKLTDNTVFLDINVKSHEKLKIVGTKPFNYFGNMTINGYAYFGTKVDGFGKLKINYGGCVKSKHDINLSSIEAIGILEFV